jgi:two-component system KDP operon response regulator KdpE
MAPARASGAEAELAPDPVPGLAGDSRPGRATCVLVVDDDPQVLRDLAINLRARHYQVLVASSGRDALTVAAAHNPDLILLDLGLPESDGVEVLRGLRRWSTAPIVILSGRCDDADKVNALDAGAADYITKPFEVAELLARLRAILRRSVPSEISPSVSFGNTTVDLAARRVTVSDGDRPIEVRLTPTEWHLVEALLIHRGRLLSHRQLLDKIWGPGYETTDGNLRVYMAQLRRKLEADPARPRHLLTEPGMGYRFQLPERDPDPDEGSAADSSQESCVNGPTAE